MGLRRDMLRERCSPRGSAGSSWWENKNKIRRTGGAHKPRSSSLLRERELESARRGLVKAPSLRFNCSTCGGWSPVHDAGLT